MLSSFVDECQLMDEIADKRSKQLVDSVDFYCAVSQELRKLQPKKLTKEEILKKKQKETLQKMTNNSYFENLHYKKELKKHGII